MKGAVNVAKRLVGTYQNLPRILNVDTGTYTVGYTEVNTQATTAFSRVKMHKAWLAGETDIQNGSRIMDRVDGHRYIVMSLKGEYISGSIAFIDGTLMYVNTTCTIERLNSNVDAFGRASDASFTPVASGVWLMINPMSTVSVEYEEVISTKDKIKVAMQSSVDVKVNDRLATEEGDIYKVDSIIRAEMENVVVLYVSQDSR